ncbi:hypothetical protein NXX23_25115 [Bacteroides ovatus]|nr:hypothetical protein [Bacteroides ovatus]
MTACYSTTQINVTNNAGSNKLGAFVASNSTGINQCYFVGETVTNPVGSGSVNGISKVTATQLKDKKRQMNLAIEAKDPEFGFSFKVNEDAGTNIYCPLILQGGCERTWLRWIRFWRWW